MMNDFKHFLDKDAVVERMNSLCGEGEPFLFIVDFKGEKGLVLDSLDLKDSDILCSINGVELNGVSPQIDLLTPELELTPISFEEYKMAFDRAVARIKGGDSYLLNLTFPTNLGCNLDLKSIYMSAKAPYKMLFGNDFVFYSPESFIKIYDNQIYSFPMKGTIDATIQGAEALLIGDEKERYEHNTIVDLIRNDLSVVSKGVKVDRFRYVERIKTSSSEILQTSSQISGNLESNWRSKFGDILFSMLPAGSVSGAPKQKTLEIIAECEESERGFYCGVMGYFDGVGVDSCVIIRYIERDDEGAFFYRSGGGITSRSSVKDEYEELIKKVYVPTI